ncbi:TPA: glycosyltransferase family 4 protein [Vibrio parahaemolyticus]|nr:glycosyltransferase family 4 protein [Vibrio parahaemolyticus]
MALSICFILPGPRREPVGGYKICYQYADYLSSRGYDVSIFYLTNTLTTGDRFSSLLGGVKKAVLSKSNFYKWYTFTHPIKHMVINDINDEILNKYDKVICTSVETMLSVDKVSNISSQLFYFIQDFEDWQFSKSIVSGSYRVDGVKNITISHDLKNIVESFGGKVDSVVFNGIDKNIFNEVKTFHERDENSLCFMYHPNKRKGCDLLIDAIDKMYKKDKNYKIKCFSAYQKPKDFPSYIEYVFRPTPKELNEIYNSCRYFICSSRYEGFGLTPAEASFSGCLVLTTDNGGVTQYIKNGVTGIVFPQLTSDSILNTIISLREKEENRLAKLAKFGKSNTEKLLDICHSYKEFEKIIIGKY